MARYLSTADVRTVAGALLECVRHIRGQHVTIAELTTLTAEDEMCDAIAGAAIALRKLGRVADADRIEEGLDP